LRASAVIEAEQLSGKGSTSPCADGSDWVTVGPSKLIRQSVLDFFGDNFEIREGKAIVPGGAKSAGAWGDLVGVSLDKGADFFEKVMMKDDGWLANLFDALARIHGPVEEYLTAPARIKRFYAAIRRARDRRPYYCRVAR
jgi:hypothetical protein